MKKLTDPDFVWVPSYKTDVMATWVKHGFVPPTIDKEKQQEYLDANQTHDKRLVEEQRAVDRSANGLSVGQKRRGRTKNTV